MISYLIFLLFFGGGCNTIIAQSTTYNDEKRVEEIQQQVLDIYDKLLKSTVRVEVGSAAGTGVLISEDGYVLSAAHVVAAVEKRKGKIRLYDGTVYTATCLGKNKIADYGLMKIESDKKFIFSELGTPIDLAKDEACLMLGHPASDEKERPPIGRIGFYKGVTNGDYLKTSCIMMPGDSGGPIFDLNGKVIGVCSYVNSAINENYYASVYNVKKHWDKLVNGESFGNIKSRYKSTAVEVTEKEKPFVLKGGKETISKVLSKKRNDIDKAVVAIESILDGDAFKTQGTLINKKGYIIAKSSQIGNNSIQCTLHNGNKIQAQMVGRDLVNDLVVLKIKTREKLNAINLDINSAEKAGQLLGTVSSKGDIAWSGIFGLESRKIKTKDTGDLGVEFEEKENVIVKRTIEGKAANKAGILAGDEIVKFNEVAINIKKDLRRALSKTKPNEKVIATILRGGAEKDIEVVLGRKRVDYMKNHVAGGIKTTKIRDDFPKAFTHDMSILPSDCGTPVINLQGKVIGINIARRNRVSSLAISLAHIKTVVNKILKTTDKKS
ncbi:trypsin-like peptidase domain-containing protein [Flavivirga spongiicola]|uniref:Trypsin-like peptidase domain-containing protein n=1 Tax=Flavivirga spongiicola TaxID=421621 RepID=A0ABU7XVH4_9FLAO|nr:trypsin-like peptidase domain-containing protein [Flavivirga sp. MEBiC05379]MDO5979503.1 trypsin-like peptidase domain-containing protein [Flavivirga sp. MEBiC05379]